MTPKERIEAGLNTTILIVGDSLTPEESYGYPYRVAELLGIKYPTAKVMIEMRSFDLTQPLPPASCIQTGTGGPTITIIRDGVPGSTSLQAISSPRFDRIFSETPIHLFSMFFGTNDFLQSYDNNNYISNLVFLGNTAKQTYGADVTVITPAWYGNYLNLGIAGYASLARLAAYRGGFKCVDASKIFQQHYQLGNGLFGQGDWFADPNDTVHFSRNGHYAIADEFMRVNFS